MVSLFFAFLAVRGGRALVAAHTICWCLRTGVVARTPRRLRVQAAGRSLRIEKRTRKARYEENSPEACVHSALGAGGNVLLYQSLAKHLAPEIPLYGLQSQGLNGDNPPLQSIEQMAELYIQEIRSVQPHGPYYLGGYCLGGTVAYEMAQRLTSEGEQVAL